MALCDSEELFNSKEATRQLLTVVLKHDVT